MEFEIDICEFLNFLDLFCCCLNSDNELFEEFLPEI